MRYMLCLLGLFAPAPALSANEVSLASDVFVERAKPDADGKPMVVLEEPKVVTPGDKLVFVLSYRNGGGQPASDFVVTNPVPSAVTYAGSDAPEPTVSVDGGKSWGALAQLKVAQPDGSSRAALPADVTHVRWTLAQAIPAGAGGKLSFRGVVK